MSILSDKTAGIDKDASIAKQGAGKAAPQGGGQTNDASRDQSAAGEGRDLVKESAIKVARKMESKI